MFSLSAVLKIFFNNANKKVWTDRKNITTALTIVVHQDARAYISETDFNKYFNGTNKGRSLYAIVQDEINETNFSKYILGAETRLLDTNYHERAFDLSKTLIEILELLKKSDNLTKSVYLGLMNSYKLNKIERPYLFLAECLFYSLAFNHDEDLSYNLLDFSYETSISSLLLEEKVAEAERYSKWC